MAHVDDEALVDLKRELGNFQRATGNRDYEASLLAGAAQELLDQAHHTNVDPPAEASPPPCVPIRPATITTDIATPVTRQADAADARRAAR